jgi:hypothetical protein
MSARRPENLRLHTGVIFVELALEPALFLLLNNLGVLLMDFSSLMPCRC